MIVIAELKDDVLGRISSRWNVAQFVSFGPGADPMVRHVRVNGVPADAALGPTAAIELLLDRSPSGTVNVRAFTAERPKGNAFHYGLDTVEATIAHVRGLAQLGFFTIVNETIDVHDGGVSGVVLGDVVEFAPGGTPRVVEEPGLLSLSWALADRLLSTVYGTRVPEADDGNRVEFSVHPHGVGLYCQRTVVWEVALDDSAAALAGLRDRPRWPNRFSEHLGDKTFGLLLAAVLDGPVPRTEVLPRSMPPFTFGRPTGHDSRWVRTAPRRFAAGKFTTARGWLDPFALLAKEDPDGSAIGAVLVQQGVRARWSGAARVDPDGALVVEGVAGAGDVFMLGEQPPVGLPVDVEQAVAALCHRFTAELGPVRIEWVHDGECAWILQLNQLDTTVHQEIVSGAAQEWLDFDPHDGLDTLRSLIEQAVARGAGVRVVRLVGLTSHVGDLLRAARIPARFASST